MEKRLRMVRGNKLAKSLTLVVLLFFLYPAPANTVYNCLITGQKNLAVCCCENTPITTGARGTASHECSSEKYPTLGPTCSTVMSPQALASNPSRGCCEISYTDQAFTYLAPRAPGDDKRKSSGGSACCRASSVEMFQAPHLVARQSVDDPPPGPPPYLLFSRFIC